MEHLFDISHLLQVVLFLFGECEKKPFLRHLTNKAAAITKMSNHFLSNSRLNNSRHLFFARSRTQNVIPTEIIHVCVLIGFFCVSLVTLFIGEKKTWLPKLLKCCPHIKKNVFHGLSKQINREHEAVDRWLDILMKIHYS